MPDSNETSKKNLVDFVAEVSGEEMLRIEEDFGEGFVRLRTSEAERRQAKHDIRSTEDITIELLRNSRDAGAKKIYVATLKEGNHRLITIIDDGTGIPKEMWSKVFEPRVTSKLDSAHIDEWGLHGRGMALYSIKSNAKEAAVKASVPSGGTAISVLVNLETLGEKTDQSTFPVIYVDDEGEKRIGRGPHNIIRKILEFSFAHRDITVYYGNPTEIAAVVYSNAQKITTKEDFLFCDNPDQLDVPVQLAACVDAYELAKQALKIGLPISERTAHRIMNSEIPIIKPLLSRLTAIRGNSEDQAETEIDIFKDERGLKISKQDISDFAVELEHAFIGLAEKYMITLCDAPKIRVTKEKITVSFPYEKEQ